MKRLSVFVSILMLSLGLFGGVFSPEKAMAQLGTVVATKSMIMETSNKIFSSAVQNLKPSSSKLDAALFTLIKGAQSVYDKSVKADYDSGANLSAQKIYTTALQKALDYINANKSTLVDQRSLDIIGAVSSQINTEIASQGLVQNYSTPTASATAATNAVQKATTVPAPDKQKSCVIWDWSIADCIDISVTWLIKNTILQVGGFLVWLTANMFNYAVQMGILEFSQWAPDTLYPIWTIVRQIISLVIVFVGLYLGFMYILGKEDKFEKYIPWVVMFGLFVNFSYPLTRTIIDISNITSLNIYASAVGPGALDAGFTSQTTAGALIMDKLGLQGLIGDVVSTEKLGILESVNSIPGALVAVVYVFYAAYIFFQVTAIILMRTIALVFIIIASPLLLVDSVLPMLGSKAKELRGIFFNQLIVGPVFMIMLALTLKFLDVFTMIGPNMNKVGDGVAKGENIIVFFNIMMMLGMLHVMIKVTKSFSGELGKLATDALGTVSGIGLGMATGGLGILGRQGIGRLATKAQGTWIAKDPNSMGGRIANTLSTSTFDLRNSSVVAGGTARLGMNRGILGMGGMGGGSASKASFQSNAEAKAKRIEVSANARFKTKYERDTVDENGFHRKGDDNLDEIKKRQEFMASKGSSLFLTKEQQQKFIDGETDDQAGRSLSEYNKLKTDEAKDTSYKKMQKELAEAEKSDPKFETAKAQALRRTVEDIKKKRGEDNEAFGKEFDKNLKVYTAMTEEKRKVFLAGQTKEMQDSILAGKNLIAEKEASATTTSSTPSTTSSSSTPIADTDWSQYNTPAVNRREDATTLSSGSGSSPVSEEMVPFPTLDRTSTPLTRPVKQEGEDSHAYIARVIQYKKAVKDQVAQEEPVTV